MIPLIRKQLGMQLCILCRGCALPELSWTVSGLAWTHFESELAYPRLKQSWRFIYFWVCTCKTKFEKCNPNACGWGCTLANLGNDQFWLMSALEGLKGPSFGMRGPCVDGDAIFNFRMPFIGLKGPSSDLRGPFFERFLCWLERSLYGPEKGPFKPKKGPFWPTKALFLADKTFCLKKPSIDLRRPCVGMGGPCQPERLTRRILSTSWEGPFEQTEGPVQLTEALFLPRGVLC